MIFPKLRFESTVQVDDKLRLDVNNSFTIGETVTDVLIRPQLDEQFYSVYDPNDSTNRCDGWFLDWAYKTSGTQTVTVRVTAGGDQEDKDFNITTLTETEDMLFSTDQDLYPYEPNIDKYLPIGKCSFLYAHRESQTKIIEYLDEQRIWKTVNGKPAKFVKSDLTNVEEFRRWSLFQTLLIIFESNQLNTNDIFQEKKQEYETQMRQARTRASLWLDVDGDGKTEIVNIHTARMVRR